MYIKKLKIKWMWGQYQGSTLYCSGHTLFYLHFAEMKFCPYNIALYGLNFCS